MGRLRWIDSEGLYFDARLVGLLGHEGLHVYIILWGLADDFGGYEANYETIALKTGALRIPADRIQQHISTLIGERKIVPYRDEEKKTYHWIRSFHKYQRGVKPRPPTIPLPPWIQCEILSYPSGRKYAKYTIDETALRMDRKESSENTGDHNPSDGPRTVRGQSSDTSRTLSNLTKPNLKRPEAPPVLFDDSFFSEIDPKAKELREKLGVTDKKFPYNWIGEKRKRGWSPEEISFVFDICVKEAIKYKPRDLYPYFETIWVREAQNFRERKAIQAHEDRRKEEDNGFQSLADILMKRKED